MIIVKEEIMEYGKENSLMEILNELALHCSSQMGKPVRIKLTLPKSVVDNFSKTFGPIEKITTFVNGVPVYSIRELYLSDGSVVELEPEEKV